MIRSLVLQSTPALHTQSNHFSPLLRHRQARCHRRVADKRFDCVRVQAAAKVKRSIEHLDDHCRVVHIHRSFDRRSNGALEPVRAAQRLRIVEGALAPLLAAGQDLEKIKLPTARLPAAAPVLICPWDLRIQQPDRGRIRIETG